MEKLIKIDQDQREEENFYEALNRHPILKSRMMNILKLVENTEVERADEAERQAIEELRGMGQEVLQEWAIGQANRSACEAEMEEVLKDGKKSLLAYYLWNDRSRRTMF